MYTQALRIQPMRHGGRVLGTLRVRIGDPDFPAATCVQSFLDGTVLRFFNVRPLMEKVCSNEFLSRFSEKVPELSFRFRACAVGPRILPRRSASFHPSTN